MLDRDDRAWLQRLLGPGVSFDESMARHTSFRIGGPADALVQPESEAQLKAILQWTRKTQKPYLVIGGGTNLLVRDGGIRGLVIHLGRLAAKITWQMQQGQVRVQAGAAIPTRRICRVALQHGWQGINFALGIPGTVGGAILMNAGTALGAMADILEAVTIMTATGEKLKVTRASMNPGYRHLQFSADALDGTAEPVVVLSGHMNLTLGDRGALRAHARQLMKQRAARQPGWQPSAGCFFKNPSMDKPAGRLIDEAGLKGLRVGDAQVSLRHANFIINLGRASAEEVLALSAKVQERVQNHAGVLLTPEVRIVGEEKTNP
jgi:UDP-N-acetylmuramate dehydrogenase